MEGLFSGLTPQQVMEQERQARSKLNLSLAQSADPLAGTLFRGAETADALRRNVADIFGNPIQESAAVTAAKEQETFRNEIARMMQEGIAAGEPRDITAKKIQSFLLSKGKVAEAEQMRAQGITEAQTATEATAKVGKLEAETKKALAEANRQKIPAYGPDYEGAAKTKGGKTFDQLTPEEAAQVIKEVNDRKVEVARGAVANTIATDIVKANVDLLNKVQQKIVDNSEFIQSIEEARSKTELPMITGSAAEKRLAISKYFSDLGFGSVLSAEKIKNTESFSAAQTDLLLKKIGGSLGAQISDKDRETIKGMMGSIEQNPASLNAIFDYLKQIAVSRENVLLKQQDKFAEAINTQKPVRISPADLRGGTPMPELPPKPQPRPKQKLNPKTEAFLSNPANAANFEKWVKEQNITIAN